MGKRETLKQTSPYGFLWHTLLVFLGLFLLLSGNGPRSFKDFCRATVRFLILCGIAFCINLLFLRASGGEINMFFVGPVNNPLVVFNQIAVRFGWYSAATIYIPCVPWSMADLYCRVAVPAKEKLSMADLPSVKIYTFSGAVYLTQAKGGAELSSWKPK